MVQFNHHTVPKDQIYSKKKKSKYLYKKLNTKKAGQWRRKERQESEWGEEDSYILRYPLLDSKANTPTLKKTIPGPAFFPISLNDIFLMKSYITPNSSTFGLISNTAKALDTPSKDGWLWPLLWSEQSVNGLIN